MSGYTVPAGTLTDLQVAVERGETGVVWALAQAIAADAYRAGRGTCDCHADLRDFTLAIARELTDSGERTSFDAVLEEFGLDRAALEATPDDGCESVRQGAVDRTRARKSKA